MPAERLSMRQIRDVLRLCYAAKLPQRAVARSLGLSQGAVSGYLSRARAAGITWPLPEDLDDARLEALLFPPPCRTPADQRPMPDWAWVHHELRRPDVTLALLWEEYRAGAADGFSYSWFCDLYRAWVGRLKPTMRQVHGIHPVTTARTISPTVVMAHRGCRTGSVSMVFNASVSDRPR
jgi:hypothetical protein